MKPEQRKRQSGFTLLEVLIAVAIVAMGLSAVFMQLNQMASSAIYQREKTLATWIAMDRVTELRLADQTPELKETKDTTEMLGVEWGYTIKVSETPVETLRRIDVTVYYADTPENIIGSAAGFIGRVTERKTLPVLPGTGAAPGDDQGVVR